MGSSNSKGNRLSSFKDYDEIIIDPQLTRGAMVEIERGGFKHWVLCEGVNRRAGIAWCYHVTSDKVSSSHKGTVGSNAHSWHRLDPKGWISYEPLRDIMRKEADGTDGQSAYDLCRVNNQECRAQRHGLNELNLNVVFANLNRLKDTKVDYQLLRNNCEWYCTLWKYGEGWSNQVTRAEWIGMGVGVGVGILAALGATFCFVAGIGFVLCIGVDVFVILGFGLYLGLKEYKSNKWKDHVMYVTELFSREGPAGNLSLPAITMRAMSL